MRSRTSPSNPFMIDNMVNSTVTPSAFYFGASSLAACADSLFVDGLRLPDQGWLLSLLTGGAPLDRFEFFGSMREIAGQLRLRPGDAGGAQVRQPVIRSLLETDLYKFTMQQPMLHSMPTNQAEYHFVCRNTPAFALAELQAEVNAELDALCELRFTEDELAYLGAMRFLSSDYIDFLRLFQFQRRFITVHTHGESLSVVAKGPQVHIMGFEIYVLAIINELYFRRLLGINTSALALHQALPT